MYFSRHNKLMILLVLFLSFLLFLAGCRNPDDSAIDQAQGRIALVTKPGDRSGDAMAARLSQSDAFKDLHVVTAVPGPPAEEQLRLLSEEGYLMIVASSPDYALDVTIVAPDFPGTVYVIFDAIVEGDNIASVMPDFSDGLMRAGVLAALAADYLPIEQPTPTPYQAPYPSPEDQEPPHSLTVSIITSAANPLGDEWQSAIIEGVARTGKPINVTSAAAVSGQTGSRRQRNTLDALINEALQQNAYIICIDGSIPMDQISETIGAHSIYLIGIAHDISFLIPGKVLASVIVFPEVILLPILEDARHRKFEGAVLTPSDTNGGVGFANLQGLPRNIEELVAEQIGSTNKPGDLPEAR